MINSIQRVASKMGGSAVEYKKILKEATSNENWNIANSKLQVLADHTYNWEDYVVISKHLWKTVNSKPKEWRRIFKALSCMDYLVKNGAPRVVQDLKDDMYKIRGLQDFSYQENGVDRGQGVRDKSRELCELLQDPNMLQQEREFARQTREKLSGMTDAGHSVSSMSGGPDGMNPVVGGPVKGSAGPASGKYGGFGSEDIARLGYNQEGQFSNVYDPYTKSQAAPSQATHQANNTLKPISTKEKKSKKSKNKNKKKKRDDDSSDDSDSSDASSDDSDSSSESSAEKEKKSKKEAKRRSKQSKDDTKAAEDKKGVNLKEVPKSARSIGGVTIQGSNVQFTEASAQKTTEVTKSQEQPQAQAAQPSQQQLLMDLFDAPSQTQQATQQQQQPQMQQQQQPSGFGFMQNPQPQAQPTNMFGGMNMSQSNQPTQQQQQTPQQSMFQNMQMGGQQHQQPVIQQKQPAMQQQPQSNSSGFGFLSNSSSMQPQQQQMGQSQQQPLGQPQQPQQNAFGFMNTQQQQSFGQPQTQQQQPMQQFGQQQTPQQQPVQKFNSQPQTQQMTNLFGGLNLNSNANTSTQQPTMQAQHQPASQAQQEMFGSFQSAGMAQEVKTESKDNFGGLFDFDSLKQEQLNVAKKHELEKQTSLEQSQSLLMTKPDDDFDSFFNKPALGQQQQPMMQSNSMTGFGASGSMPTQGGQGLQQRPQMNQGFTPNNPGMQANNLNNGMQNFGAMNMAQGHQPNSMGMGMQNNFGAPMGGINQMPMMANQQQQQFRQQQQQQFPQQQQSNFGFMR